MTGKNILLLKVMEPEKILVQTSVNKVIAEGLNGSFCIKPKHIDFVSALKPGILEYTTEENEEFIALDEGILVKCGQDVLVSVLNGVPGTDLSMLEKTVREQFQKTEAMNKATDIALKGMEADLLMHFVELDKEK
ncbi:F0F1 ATP synthase subunit epsilon [Rhodohalobacter mucosus]|uniref:F0F1 ATP synthase subunit epsilon n=1 Tax=Rhodohalobacter mucosus TaxID=2079485 RepID=A0A316TQM8_9BACT|nr:F0F1 ATP synthase subunit epsilon [Rhodohalobacter mucosus]PWN05991.1 F0F1 ATP synthase subunit epsilon [Rhodohalobacter mucosus]